MSLLDDVSIVVTPNGYKAGELYAVVPVPTEGAEEVTNGDFATDSDWDKSPSGVTISGGFANFTSGQDTYVFQDIMVIGKRYIMSLDYNITSITGSAYFGSNGGSGNAILSMTGLTGAGTLSGEITASATKLIVRSSTFSGTVTNISVKEYTSADMDVTRATAATRVDENGLVNYAEVLGDIYASNFSSGVDGWTAFGLGGVAGGISIGGEDNSLRYTVTTPIGDTRAFKKTSTLTVGLQYKVTFSYYIPSTNPNLNAVFLQGSNVRNSVLDTWTTVTEYFTASSVDTQIIVGDADMYLNPAATGETAYIKDVLIKEVTRDNVPRIDYTGGGCPHILAEPQRTNLITYSSDFSQSYWIKQSNITPTYNTTETLSPDGTYNATKLVGNGTDGVYAVNISITGVVARSVYLKSVTGTVNVILKDPNITVTSPTLDVTTEWQRFELSEDNGTSLQGLWIDDIPASGIYMWGAQVEESYPTSYIPTSGSTVTRNQDIFTRDGIGSLINSTEGVLFAEMAALSNDSVQKFISLGDGTTTNRLILGFDNSSNRIISFARVGGGLSFDIKVVISDVQEYNKIAIKWKENDFALWGNGVELGVDSSGASFTSGVLSDLRFSDADGTTEIFYGKVKQLQVYNTALTDEQLLQLTGTSGTDFYESYAEMASALTYTIQ